MSAENAALFWNETAGWGTVYLSPFQSRVQFRFGTGQSGQVFRLPFTDSDRERDPDGHADGFANADANSNSHPDPH